MADDRPFRAGKVNAVAGVPGNPGVYYFAADGGGVWKTTDGGRCGNRFSTKSRSLDWCADAGAFECDIIYVGTGVNTIFCRQQLWRWEFTNPLTAGKTGNTSDWGNTRHIGRILVDPHNPDIVLVAAMGHSSGPNEERGVFRSTDGGRKLEESAVQRQSYRSGGSLF